MAFSAMPFWKWALTPQKVSRCPLPLVTTAVLEGIFCELSIVAIVVEDADAVMLGKVLNCLFGFHHLFGGKLGHEVDVLQP
jgi:hypothetical protein